MSGIIGIIEGVIVSVIILVSFSTIPFFGISTDYLASGFEKTVVMNAPYQFILKTERNIYKNALNYGEINLNASQTLDDIKLGTYNNSEEVDAKWSIIVVIDSKSTTTGPTVSVGLTNKQNTSEVFAETCKFIYVNNSLYLFSISNNKIMAICKYDKKNKTITYEKTTETETIKGNLKFISA